MGHTRTPLTAQGGVLFWVLVEFGPGIPIENGQ
jgi:hypothetical protein